MNYIKIAERLNYELYDICKNLTEEYGICIKFSSIGYNHVIKFLDIVVWDDDNDEKKYNEDTNEYEPLESFIRNKINNICSQIGKIKL